MPGKKSTSNHDKAVAKLARKLVEDGWNVSASVPGFPEPQTVGRAHPARPDIQATKGDRTRLIEVETAESVNSAHAKQQMSTLRRSAAQRDGVTVEQVVTDA